MPVTRLSDLPIVPSTFSQGINLQSLALDAFIQSGAVVHDPSLDAFLANSMGAPLITVRQLAPLADEEENISTDDPGVMSVPSKVSGLQTNAVRQSLNKSWSEMDLAVDLYGPDPLASVMSQISKYWLTRRQARLLASLTGVLADSVANNGSDLLIDKAPSYEAIGPTNVISAEAIIDSSNLMGDRSQELKWLVVHSTVFSTMQKLNLIQTEKLSDSDIFFHSYLGYPVIRDDGLTVETIPAVVGGGSAHPAYNIYSSFLFGYGAFSFGAGSPKTPFEILRTPAAGNGGGQETIYHRVEWVLHPQGYSTTLTSTPTIAQLQTGASWTRVWERKRIPLAVIKTRG